MSNQSKSLYVSRILAGCTFPVKESCSKGIGSELERQTGFCKYIANSDSGRLRFLTDLFPLSDLVPGVGLKTFLMTKYASKTARPNSQCAITVQMDRDTVSSLMSKNRKKSWLRPAVRVEVKMISINGVVSWTSRHLRMESHRNKATESISLTRRLTTSSSRQKQKMLGDQMTAEQVKGLDKLRSPMIIGVRMTILG